MIIHSIFFYFFSLITVFASLLVILSRNTVNSVFFLILCFISVGSLFIMIGAEFLGMIMLIVYVGAVAILFLFVVMMINVAGQTYSKKSQFEIKKHVPIGILFSIILLLELFVIIGGWKYKDKFVLSKDIMINPAMSNTKAIGTVLYTDYILLFQISGMILLLAMIGAIMLTFRKREGVKRQSYFEQISREKASGVEIKDVPFNQGVKIND
jgi:NADH-quinone oxidoreductase subunit J